MIHEYLFLVSCDGDILKESTAVIIRVKEQARQATSTKNVEASRSLLAACTACLCPSRSVRDQVSHPYKRTLKIIILYILSFTFLDNGGKEKGFELNGVKYSLYLICS
jgi:hypothetical protein